MSRYSAHHFPHPARALREIAHVLAPGDTVLLVHKAVAGADVQGVLIRGPEARALNHSIYLRYISPEGLEQPAVAEALTADDITLRVSMEEVISWDLTGLEFARVLREHNQAYEIE